MNSETRQCQNCKQAFTIEPDDFSFYEKIKVPPPTFCPECRLIRRMTWRNERTLYSRPCDMCKKQTIGVYPTTAPYTVYCRDCWWGDTWDPNTFEKEYDFSSPFFTQFKELLDKVPRISMTGSNNINSDYANYSLSNKNVYLCFASHYNEDGAYLQYSNKTKSSYDCLHVMNSEYVVDCNYCTHLYRCAHLAYADSCSDVILGYDLRGCNNCFGCVGLRQKSYCIFNIQYSKEEYQNKIAELTANRESFAEARKTFNNLKQKFPRLFSYQRKCVNCTGNDLEESKFLLDAFSIRTSENSRYVYVNCVNIKDSMDMNNIAYDPTELCYEAQGVTNSNNAKFVDASWNNNGIEYTNLCFASENLFGCIGLRSKKYFILNKEYSKEKYSEMVAKIRQHMEEMPYIDKEGNLYRYGEFFPSELSPFAYNETIAMTYYPLSEKETQNRGYRWQKDIERKYTITKAWNNIESDPSKYDIAITEEVISCEHNSLCTDKCTSAFRILPDELEVIKSLKIQLPTLCPNCRNMERIKARGPFLLYSRVCMCNEITHNHSSNSCQNEFETSYAPDRLEKVYCEQCYQQEVV